MEGQDDGVARRTVLMSAGVGIGAGLVSGLRATQAEGAAGDAFNVCTGHATTVLELATGQEPFAIILGCADSRVPAEIVFDQGLGDLFVIRVAGNVVDGAGVTVKGSIEYAIAELNVPLVVVLGHTSCGAVKAAVKHIDQKDSLPGAINGLVELIKPAVIKVQGAPGDIYDNATRENVRIGVEKLKNLQPILAPRVADGSVKVVGGVYDLRTGKVEMLPVQSK